MKEPDSDDVTTREGKAVPGVEDVRPQEKEEPSAKPPDEEPQYSPEKLQEAQEQAENGSAEGQLILGRHLFRQAELGISAEGNGPLAVAWLIKASKQGSDEATALLQKCFERGIGITEENEVEAEWCIGTSGLEKSARQAAKRMFHMLNPLGTNQVTKDDYMRALNTLGFSKAEKKLLERAGKFKDDDTLSESAFVEKMVSRLHGSGGATLNSLLKKEEGETFQSASYMRKIFYYPGKTLVGVADHSVEFAAKQGMSWLKTLIPTQQIHMLLVFFLYSVLSFHFFLHVIPLFLFYFSLLTMIVCTLQMFYGKRKLKDVEAMANMLNRFNETLDTDGAVSSYTWNSITPYFSYFVALFVLLISFSLADKSWIPCSELVCIGVFFAMTCFAALSDQYDHLVILSIVANFVSTLPTMIESFPQIPGLYHVVQLFAGSVISVQIIPDIVINIGLPSMVYLIVPILFLRMALQKSGQGVYRVLIPHLVCFFWWQVSMVMFRHSTWLGLVRGSLGWLLLIMLAPVLFLVLFAYLLFTLSKILTISGILKLVTTLVMLAIPACVGFWAKKGFKIKGFSFEKKTGKIILVILSVFTVFPMMYFITPTEVDVGGNYLTWDQYAQFCSHPQWDQTNIADSQIKCSHLTNMVAAWSGRVKKVTIKKIDNGAESFVNLLPTMLGEWLRCTYGDEYPPCDTVTEQEERELCEMYTMQNRKCHMHAMDYYTFELWVTMEVSEGINHDIRIESRDSFRNVLLKLKADDKVSFRAALQSDMGNTWPVLKMYHVECTSCMQTLESTQEEEEEAIGPVHVLAAMKNALFDTLNFFVAPVVEFGKNYE